MFHLSLIINNTFISRSSKYSSAFYNSYNYILYLNIVNRFGDIEQIYKNTFNPNVIHIHNCISISKCPITAGINGCYIKK